MNQTQLESFLFSASAFRSEHGWIEVPEHRHITLHVSHNGVGLTVSKVETVSVRDEVVRVQTRKGERYQLLLDDVFAAAMEAPQDGERKAGFGAER